MSWQRRWFLYTLITVLCGTLACSRIFHWPLAMSIAATALIVSAYAAAAAIYYLARFVTYLVRRRRWLILTPMVLLALSPLPYFWSCFQQARAIDALFPETGGWIKFEGESRLKSRRDLDTNLRTYLSWVSDACFNNRPIPALARWQKYFSRVVEVNVSCTRNRELCHHVARLRDLERLYVDFVDGEDAYGLANFQRLGVLGIGFRKNPDAGLSYLARLTRLTWLSIESDDRVTDRGVQQLSGLKSLKYLSIHPSAITDDGLVAIKDLPLTVLRLDDSRITDGGLQVTHKMPLAELSVKNTKVTRAALRDLRKRNPGIYIDGLYNSAEALAVHKLQARGFVLEGDGIAGDVWTVRQAVADAGNPREFDEICDLIAQLKQVREVVLGVFEPTVHGMQQIGKLSQLEFLTVAGGVTDEQLAGVANLSQLRKLVLVNCPITDAGMAVCSKLTALEELELTKTQIKGPGLQHLAGLRRLRRLALIYCPIDDDALAHLSKLPKVEWLNLEGNKIHGEGLKHFANHPNLNMLILTGTQVTDSSIAVLSNCPNLNRLSVENTKVTARGASSVRAAALREGGSGKLYIER